MSNLTLYNEKWRHVAQAVDVPIARPNIPPTWHRIGPIWLGHGPKRAVFLNPDLIFLRSGFKLTENKPKWWHFFVQNTPNIGSAEPSSDPKVHDLVSNIYIFQPGLSNTHAKNVQDSPNIGATPKLMLLYLIYPSITATETVGLQKLPKLHKRSWTIFST